MLNLENVVNAWVNVDAIAHDLLAPIESEDAYQTALSAVDGLINRVNDGAEHLDSLLEILIERVVAYEARIMPPRERRPEGVLAYLMEDRALTQSALAQAAGIDQSTLSKLLKAERAFSKAHIKKLSDFFGVAPTVFMS